MQKTRSQQETILRDRCVLMNLLTDYNLGRIYIKGGNVTNVLFITLRGYEDNGKC